MTSRLRTLVLHAKYAGQLSYFDDWLDAFREAPQFQVDILDIVESGAAARLRRMRDEYDLIVLHHSTNGDWLAKIEELAPILADRRGLLFSFVGNEVNLPGMTMAAKLALFRRIRPEWVATQLLLEAGEYLYRDVVGRGVVAIPHALNPKAFQPSDAPRAIDIGVRTATYSAYLGDNDRQRLIDVFEKRTFDPPLAVDISTTERFDRAGWAGFLNKCKGTIATEAGSWYLQRDDRTIREIREWVLAKEGRRGFVLRTDGPLQKLAVRIPQPVRRWIRQRLRGGPLKLEVNVYDNLDVDEVQERFFRHTPRAPVYSKCISSRHFDAVGTKTCQIMFRGRYNDILEAGTHYLALDEDLSNLDEVLRRFRDPGERARIVDAAHQHVLAAHTYAHRMEAIAATVSASRRP